MAIGDLITRSALSTGWLGSPSYSSKDITAWVCAPVLRVVFHQKTEGILTKTLRAKVWKWDGPGTTTFTQIHHQTTTTRGNTKEIIFNHNSNVGSPDKSDTSTIHLYRVRLESDGGSNATVYMQVYYGGVGHSSNTNANTYTDGELIYGIKPEVWKIGTYGDSPTSEDANFVAAHLRTSMKGTVITDSTKDYCCTEY